MLKYFSKKITFQFGMCSLYAKIKSAKSFIFMVIIKQHKFIISQALNDTSAEQQKQNLAYANE